MASNFKIDEIDFSKDENGLIPAVVQHFQTGEILMLGFINRQALEKTIETKFAHFFSRSRKRIWKKGEQSGNFLKMKAIRTDCDKDSVIYFCNPKGPTCHLGNNSCFTRSCSFFPDFELLANLERIILDRKKNMPENSYVSSLLQSGNDRVIQKFGEEAIETIIAAKNKDQKNFLGESADVFFHFLVLLAIRNEDISSVCQILKNRYC